MLHPWKSRHKRHGYITLIWMTPFSAICLLTTLTPLTVIMPTLQFPRVGKRTAWHPLPTPSPKPRLQSREGGFVDHVTQLQSNRPIFPLKMAPWFRGIVDSFRIYFPGVAESLPNAKVSLEEGVRSWIKLR